MNMFYFILASVALIVGVVIILVAFIAPPKGRKIPVQVGFRADPLVHFSARIGRELLGILPNLPHSPMRERIIDKYDARTRRMLRMAGNPWGVDEVTFRIVQGVYAVAGAVFAGMIAYTMFGITIAALAVPGGFLFGARLPIMQHEHIIADRLHVFNRELASMLSAINMAHVNRSFMGAIKEVLDLREDTVTSNELNRSFESAIQQVHSGVSQRAAMLNWAEKAPSESHRLFGVEIGDNIEDPAAIQRTISRFNTMIAHERSEMIREEGGKIPTFGTVVFFIFFMVAMATAILAPSVFTIDNATLF